MKYNVYTSHHRTTLLSTNIHLELGMYHTSESECHLRDHAWAVCERHDYRFGFVWTEATEVDEHWLIASWLWCPGCAELGISYGINVPSPWFVEDAGVWRN